MAASNENFDTWISEKLQQLNTDESVFASYIRGILDTDETADEKTEALTDILSEIIENETEISEICNEIFDKWLSLKPKEPPPPGISSEEVDTKLVKLLESQSLITTKQKQYTEEEKKLREAILSQYSQMTDDEGDEDETAPAKHAPAASKHVAGGEGKENGLARNLNVASVQNAEKVKREQAKLDSQKKKEKDKEDREKQKQQKEDKKEKRKTQKGERRR